jgi:glycosyltransferase involved in cell wall biosynthesis
VICVGKHIEAPLRRSLDEAGFHGLLRTVHNGANFPPMPNRRPHSGSLRLLFMGRVEALKGVFDFVPLLQRLKGLGVPATLRIVGGENEALRRRLQRKDLDAMVTWSGRVPHERCYDIAAESDIFLMTSRKEPFGMVTIEAMGMGCVPIAYNIPSGSTEIIEHGKNGVLVPLGDIRGWANQIRSLHDDRARLASLSAAAIARARTEFNADVMARNMVAYLAAVLINAKTHPAARESGMPPETPAVYAQPARGYQRLPAGLREWIRNRVYASQRLSHWLLRR